MEIPQRDVLSWQSLDGGEAADKKNGEHIVELSDSLLEWIIGIAGPHPGGHECQAEPKAGLVGDKPSELTAVELSGGERATFGNVTWKICLQNCTSMHR